MKLRLVVSIIFLGLSLSLYAWDLDKDKDGIKVYTRKAEGTNFKEYKAITNIAVNRKQVVQMVLNVTDYVNWFPDCLESKVLEKVSSTEFVVYYKIDSPWPASDRDAVIQLNLERDDDKHTTTINFKDKLKYKDELNGVVRVRNTVGYWQFIEGNDRTKVVYQCLTDPGGSIPAWITNMFVVDAPYKTLMAMKTQLEKSGSQ